jgi:Fe-S-cluster containining protein
LTDSKSPLRWTTPECPYHRSMQAFCLSIHADYACRHSGACCTAGWPIPIEDAPLSRLRERGLLAMTRPLADPRGGNRSAPELILDVTAEGACVFYDEHGRRCAIHRDAGPELLPSACRNFPRVTLRDARGIFITLSHYCPTAARMLLDASDIAIVEAPRSLSLGGAVEGLDATRVMPPLLRPGMLMDLDGYAAWEREAVDVFNDARGSPQRAVQVLGEATDDACGWSPGGETLADRVVRAFGRARARQDLTARACDDAFARPLRAFLAAHLFASWSAYGPEGLGAVVRSIESAHHLVGDRFESAETFVEAVRAADLRLRHRHPLPAPASP